MSDDDLFDYAKARDEAMDRVERNAGDDFRLRARRFIFNFLSQRGPHSSEEVTNACKDAGIIPHDDRAFGPVYMSLCRDRVIVKCGQCVRKKGHGTAGGNIWRVVV